MKFYAKTYYDEEVKTGETLQEHTENLLSGLEELKSLYSEEISSISNYEFLWQDLKIVSLFHDIGKISTPFQNKIRRALNLPELQKEKSYKEIYHNYLSPAFLAGIKELGHEDNEERFFNLLYAIAFHHERPFDFDEELLEKALGEDIFYRVDEITNWICSIYSDYEKNNFSAFYYGYLRQYLDGNNDRINELKRSKKFILLKGLLHRLDYAASAHLPVEIGRLGNTTSQIKNYLKEKFNSKDLRPFQKQGEKYRDYSIILTASTGLGKTEFAANWLGDKKSFYTLPLKVSANTMYDRLDKMFPNKVGIVHSDSYSLALENEELSIEENIQRMKESRQLSLPLIVTTADQLFTSVFKWPGYERIYATLMYSKVILDEPQSYSPKTLAMIIKALEELSELGGKFCYMSATNHPFIIKRLEKIAAKLEPVYNPEKKHKIEVIDDSIEGLINDILEAYNSRDQNKVLVISNTVKKSQELFTILNSKKINVKLLHSGFIKKHRDKKEKDIQKDFNKTTPVVWVSTQIVEASLDIDYDILFTEIATLDALIQRMGRIYRKSGRTITKSSNPNIKIAASEPSDKGYIYNKEIVQRTNNALIRYSEEILTEQLKQELMNYVYDEDEISNTNFYKQFNDSYRLLELGYQADSKTEAQKLFRDISQISAIPINIYEKNIENIEILLDLTKQKKLEQRDRLKANNELNKLMLSIPAWRVGDTGTYQLFERRNSSIFIIPAKYDENLGLKYEKISNFY